MANKKVPRRDEYDTALALIVPLLPSNYAGIVLHNRPDLNLRHVYHAKAGKVVDFDVLAEFKRVARETTANKTQQTV